MDGEEAQKGRRQREAGGGGGGGGGVELGLAAKRPGNMHSVWSDLLKLPLLLLCSVPQLDLWGSPFWLRFFVRDRFLIQPLR